ncbi:MAG: glycoside hydrolase family 3 C-terminal domain-containing protein [Candidatus Lokiarchaeota archaeon]|nr:glycoside hydrolase family 3 C-terminal domain-containing protein [Candidatus Lokiarchaeota archaeon]
MDKIFIKEGMMEEEIDDFVNRALSMMTLKEKVATMSGNNFYLLLLKDRKFGVRPYPGGGVERLGIPPFLFTDGPRGVILPGSTCFPVSMARGASWDISLEERLGEVIGKETRAHGANLFGGVCINLLRHPGWGRAQETYGEDSFHIGEFGAALVRGVQKHNVMATAKHYAANSIEHSRFKVDVQMSERTLREVYLPHFKRCIEEGCATVMSAYNKLRGEYCGHNSYLLRDILKEEWGFEGFVHSDWMNGLYNTVKGIMGGLDVEMPRAKFYGKKLEKAVKLEKVPLNLVDDSVRRILRTVLKYTTKKDPQDYNSDLIGCEDHVFLAREVAEKSMVLLKNQEEILPFDANKMDSLAVIGPLADLKNTGDHGSSNIRQKNIITPLQGIKISVGDTLKIIHNDGHDTDVAQQIAQSADSVVLVVGYTFKDEGEYIPPFSKGLGDRTNLGLKEDDIKLIDAVAKVNKKCVVVLVGGTAILMEEWKEKVPSILMAWYSGMEGGHALADILFGKVNPSGKLPFTIPEDPSHLPFFDVYVDEIEYGYYHGYTLMEKEKIEPSFPFGFGLSYTKYSYENIRVKSDEEKIIASVDVANIGAMAGEEIVQLYVGFENSSVDRPLKLLRGFKRVMLKPNETKSVSIEVNKKDLAWYNPENNTWEVENIAYTIYIGASSSYKDLLTETITV